MEKIPERSFFPVDRAIATAVLKILLLFLTQGGDAMKNHEYRTLVLDDEENIRFSLATFIEARGHEVVTASEPLSCPLYGEDACSCPSDEQCGDFAIIDQNMPRMTGLEFVRKKLNSGCKAAPENHLLISAHLTDDELAQARKLGIPCMLKPVRLEQVSAWLAAVEKKVPTTRKLKIFRNR